jgi:transposase
VVVELYRLRCPRCGVKAEKVPQLPGKAPFSKRFEDAVGEACESAAARRVARQFGLSTSTVVAIDLRYLERWSQSRRKPALRNMGVDEIHLGKKQKFITVVSNLDAAVPLWFGRDRKKDTLDEFFERRLSPFQRGGIKAACVICGIRSGRVSSSGCPSAASSMTSSMCAVKRRWSTVGASPTRELVRSTR